MLEQSTMHPVVWINQHTYISIVKNADYNLEVWEITDENRQHRMARMNYKYHRDNFAGFIYRLSTDRLDSNSQHSKEDQPVFRLRGLEVYTWIVWLFSF